jgi:hypothetical protein
MYTSFIFALLSCASAAPLLPAKANDLIQGSYIIKLKGDVSTLAETDLKASMTGFRGFAGMLTEEEVDRLQASDQV